VCLRRVDSPWSPRTVSATPACDSLHDPRIEPSNSLPDSPYTECPLHSQNNLTICDVRIAVCRSRSRHRRHMGLSAPMLTGQVHDHFYFMRILRHVLYRLNVVAIGRDGRARCDHERRAAHITGELGSSTVTVVARRMRARTSTTREEDECSSGRRT
jgi:hypothetical protein